MMTRHRIVGSEADKQRPLAYVSVYPPRRRDVARYLAAGVIGALLMLAVGVAVAALSGMVGGTS